MNRPPDDATPLMNLLVAICGDQINSYRPKIEALGPPSTRTPGL
jgi:hypothetical protein